MLKSGFIFLTDAHLTKLWRQIETERQFESVESTVTVTSVSALSLVGRQSAVCDQSRSVRWMSFKNSTICWYLLWVKTFKFSAKLSKSPVCFHRSSGFPSGLGLSRIWGGIWKERAIREWGCSIWALALSLGIPTLSRSMSELRKFPLRVEHYNIHVYVDLFGRESRVSGSCFLPKPPKPP